MPGRSATASRIAARMARMPGSRSTSARKRDELLRRSACGFAEALVQIHRRACVGRARSRRRAFRRNAKTSLASRPGRADGSSGHSRRDDGRRRGVRLRSSLRVGQRGRVPLLRAPARGDRRAPARRLHRRRARRGRLEGLPDARADRPGDARERLGRRAGRAPAGARGPRHARVRPRPAPVRAARHHRAARARGPAAPGAEDGGRRAARRRDRARLQQPADGHRRLRRDRAAADRRRPGRERAGRDPARRRAREPAHPPAARLRPPPGARAGAARRQRGRLGPGADALAADRRDDRDRDAGRATSSRPCSPTARSSSRS